MLVDRRNTVARGAVATGIVLGAAIVFDSSAATAQGWQFVEPMPITRSYHAAAAVGDRWYVAGGAAFFGGASGDRFPNEVDMYDPTSGHWTVLGQLAEGREYIRAIADASRGRVVFPGGFLPAGPDAYLALATADIATPNGVLPAPSLLGARHLHGVALAAGKFIVSGGWGMRGTASWPLDDAEVWDGTASGWMPAGTMPAGPRSGHSMTTLANGKDVLVVAGCRSDGATADVALFDAVCGTWKPLAPLQISRCNHKAVRLNDGRVLVVGGGHSSPIRAESSAEIFDPAAGQWRTTVSMHDGRFDHDMVLLPDGRILAAGGSNDTVDGEYGALSSAEIYDPMVDAWTLLPPMHDRRRAPTLAVLSDGVYVAGGSYSLTRTPGSATVLASVERLGWSELGIAGPINLDAGVPEGPLTDASTSCGPGDAGSDRGPDPDASVSGDATDASQPNDAGSELPTRDAASPDRETGGQRSGCSCDFSIAARDSFIELVGALFVIGAALRRRSRRCHERERDRRVSGRP